MTNIKIDKETDTATVALVAEGTIGEGNVRLAFGVKGIIAKIVRIHGVTIIIADICIQGITTSIEDMDIPILTRDITNICTPCLTVDITGTETIGKPFCSQSV